MHHYELGGQNLLLEKEKLLEITDIKLKIAKNEVKVNKLIQEQAALSIQLEKMELKETIRKQLEEIKQLKRNCQKQENQPADGNSVS